MIKNSFKESFRLLGRSKPECLAYLAAICLGEVFVLALSGRVGVEYPMRTAGYDIRKLAYTLALLVPGFVVSSWAGAGLMGRISMDALTGVPGPMLGYANGWFLRYLKGIIVVFAAAFIPFILLLLVPMPLAIVPVIGWFIFIIWAAVRISLWGSIMFMDGLHPLFQRLAPQCWFCTQRKSRRIPRRRTGVLCPCL